MISLLPDPERWNQALAHSSFHYVTYTYEWLEAVSAGYSHLKPLPFAKIDEKGGVEYVCPCFHDKTKSELVSSPFLSPGFISRNTDVKEMARHLIIYAKKNRIKKINLQIPPGLDYAFRLLELGYRLSEKICFHVIDTTEVDSFDDYLKNRITKSRHTDLKMAWRKGLRAEILPPTPEALRRFSPFYFELGRRRKFEILRESFLYQVTRRLAKYARFWIAAADGNDLGSALTLEYKDRIWGWLLQGGMEYRSYKTDPFLYAEIVRYGMEKGYRYIDFGTSPLNSALGDFKRRSGTRPVFHEFYVLDLSFSGLWKDTWRGWKQYAYRMWRF